MNHPGNVREQLHMDKQQHLNSGHHNATDGTNSDHPGQVPSSQHPANRHHHQHNQHQHQQSSSPLPSHVYSTSQTTWTAQELHLLHKGLTAFPSERYDSITRCIKVASTIPDKCIRDVACKIRSIHTSQAKQAMHHDQRAMSPMPQLSSSKRQKLDNNDLHMVPLTIKKEPVLSHEDAVRKGLQENDHTLHSMRANLASGQLRSNLQLMAHFRGTCNAVLKRLGAMCPAVPPLPLHLDMSLLQSHPAPPASSHNNQDDV